jgi:hypothetical protein
MWQWEMKKLGQCVSTDCNTSVSILVMDLELAWYS